MQQEFTLGIEEEYLLVDRDSMQLAHAPTALIESQREFLNERRRFDDNPWVHPYFWAVYTVAGDDRTRFAKVN